MPEETTETKNSADKVIEFGEVVTKMGKILKSLKSDDERRRVMRMVAAYYDIPLAGARDDSRS